MKPFVLAGLLVIALGVVALVYDVTERHVLVDGGPIPTVMGVVAILFGIGLIFVGRRA